MAGHKGAGKGLVLRCFGSKIKNEKVLYFPLTFAKRSARINNRCATEKENIPSSDRKAKD
ncbi:hypothetical protein D3Z51_16115 [Clostridiaceae bacterium]|nr:hypothetical protein [Clostridiaceae bacterium]RKI10596.1 hypothetical protein D7V81_15580 [bacterium 1XD21-70]